MHKESQEVWKKDRQELTGGLQISSLPGSNLCGYCGQQGSFREEEVEGFLTREAGGPPLPLLTGQEHTSQKH